AMVNHSCVPNAVKIAIEDRGAGSHLNELRAIRSIKAGEEICISYIPDSVLDYSYRARQQYLHRQFQFICTCVLCQQQSRLKTDGTESTAEALLKLEKEVQKLADLYSGY